MPTPNTASTPSVQPSALRFFKATALKRICFNDGFVEQGGPMFVAKWEGLYVVAKNDANFFIETETRAGDYVRTERNDKNKLVVAHNGPVIRPVGEKFEWVVEFGQSCPDDCDETILSSVRVANKAEALAKVANFTEPANNPYRGFARIRGPGFYQFIRPQRVAVVQPPRPAISTQRNYRDPESITINDSFINSAFYTLTGPRPTRSTRSTIDDQRVTEEILRMVREFQNAANPVGTGEVPVPAVPVPNNSTNGN